MIWEMLGINDGGFFESFTTAESYDHSYSILTHFDN